MIIVLAVLAMVLFPVTSGPRNAPRARCTNNLKHIGLVFRTWAGDNNNLFPMQALTNQDGSMKFADQSNLFRYFWAMSNELNTPKLVVCPADQKRTVAKDFGTNFSGANISYFIGLDANQLLPASVLSGDRNVTNGAKLRNGILEVTTNRPAGWTKELHNGGRDVVLSDGSVQQVTSQGLQALVAKTGLTTNRLAMP